MSDYDIFESEIEELYREPEEPKIELTVEEAKALLRRIPEFKENGDWQLPIERLKERIEQVEAQSDC